MAKSKQELIEQLEARIAARESDMAAIKKELGVGQPYSVSIAATAAGQGLTSGFSDEAIAAIKSAVQSGNIDDLIRNYQLQVAVERKKIEEAREANPALFAATEIGTGFGRDIALSFVPGGAVLRGAGSLGKALGVSAGLGAVEAAGRAEGTEETLKASALGAALGAGTTGGLRVAGAGLEKLGLLGRKKVGEVGKGFLVSAPRAASKE